MLLNGVDQPLPGNAAFENLTIEGGGTKTLAGASTINNTLTLGAGSIDTNSHTLTANGVIQNGSGGSGTTDFDSDHMIISNGTGKLRRSAAPGENVFPVGTNNGTAQYTPATLSFTRGTFGGSAYVEMAVKDAIQPNNGSTTNYLKRYWTVRSDGITGFSCDTTFRYLETDVEGSTEEKIYGASYSGVGWTGFTAVHPDTHNFSCNGVTGFSDFTGVESYTVDL